MKTFRVKNGMKNRKMRVFSNGSVEIENDAEKFLKTSLTTLGVVINS